MAKKKAAAPPTDAARDEVLAVICRQPAPVTAKQLVKLLVAPHKIAEQVLIPILDDFVVQQRLNSFPPLTPKGQRSYWNRDLIAWGCVQICTLIQKKGPQPKSKLPPAAKGLDAAQFELAFQSLLTARQLIEHPPIGKTKTSKFGDQPPDPQPYLKELGQQLTKAFGQLVAAGVERSELARIVESWLSQSGLPTMGTNAAPPVTLTTNNRSNSAESRDATNDLDLLMLMRQVEPGADRGALVTSRELRRAANLDKDQFDQSVLGLARQGRIMLHRHDHASGLTSAERDELVTDGQGTYYVGMALRRVDVEIGQTV